MTRLDWERARKSEAARGWKLTMPAPRQAGISNHQAQQLANLQRLLGLPYTGAGMSARDAAVLIARLRRQVQRDLPAATRRR